VFAYAPESWNAIGAVADYGRGRGIDVFVAWPAIMSDPRLNDGNPVVRQNIEQIVSG
jgi:hypothetical protein